MQSLKKDTGNPAEIIKYMMTKDSKNLVMFTDLSPKQIRILAKFNMYIQQFPQYFDWLQSWIEEYYCFMVSLNRKSRDEAIRGLTEMREGLLEGSILLSQGGKR